MHINRGLLFWGLAFITAGAVALGVQQGVIARDAVTGAWRLWPLILVAIGISMIASRTVLAPLGTIVGALLLGGFVGGLVAVGPGVIASCGGSPTGAAPTQARDGTFGAGAQVDIEANCATLTIATQGGSGWSFAGTGDTDLKIEAAADRLRVDTPDTSWFMTRTGHRTMRLDLPTDPTLDLSIDANAGDARLDLSSARLSGLDLNANAGQVRLDLGGTSLDGLDLEVNAGKASVMLDEQSLVTGAMSANAGSLEVCAPASVALQIKTDDSVAFDDNLDQSGLLSVGDHTWRSPSYDSAQRRVTLTVDGNAGNFTLNPQGGCA